MDTPRFKTRYECGNHEVRGGIIRFARTKLTAGKDSDARSIAPLAVRLALTFNSLTTEGIEAEQCKVESHMRVCVRIDPDANAMFTVAPSEPALVEAAAQLMYEKGTRDSPLTTLSHLSDQRRPWGTRLHVSIVIGSRRGIPQYSTSRSNPLTAIPYPAVVDQIPLYPTCDQASEHRPRRLPINGPRDAREDI